VPRVGERRAALLLLLILCSPMVALTNIETVMAAEDSWTTKANAPTAIAGYGIATVNGKIYAIVGSINYEYDPATDTWTSKTKMPTARDNPAVSVYNNKIYVFGGNGYHSGGVFGPIAATEVYDPLTDTWETKTPMPTTRHLVFANTVKDKIYLIGGHIYVGAGWPYLSNKNEVYDPETDTWTEGASMPDFSSLGYTENVASTVVDNKIYVIVDNTLRIYDPETDTWSNGSRLLTPARYGPAACATTGVLAPKRIHVLVGNTHQIYDPETDLWSNGTQMPTPRRYLGVAVIADRLYAIGGIVGSPLDPSSITTELNEQYTPYGYIPEFPSWIILPLFLTATLFAIVFKKRLFHPRS